MKAAEEILKKVCRYKESDTLDVDDEISISEALEAIKEFHDQFKVELSEGEINKMADEYLKTVGSIRYVNECRLDFINGFKQGLSYTNREDTAVDKKEIKELAKNTFKRICSFSPREELDGISKEWIIRAIEKSFTEYLNSIKGK